MVSTQPTFPVVVCPGCREPMRVIGSEPIAGGRNIATYRCERCGMETERLLTFDKAGRSAPRPLGDVVLTSRNTS